MVMSIPASGDNGPIIDNTVYAHLLKAHVADGLVDYDGFKTDGEKLDDYLKVLSKVKPETLTEPAAFAFYINAYNAWTIKLILTGYPGVTSIKNLGSLLRSPWKKELARIDGRMVTLDQIEHDILRPRFKDPRVHFAINCAALSCPPLRPEPYTEDRLEQQLEDATIRFINSPDRNYLKDDTLYVSKIFKWFNEDFNGDVPGFMKKYARGTLKQSLDGAGGPLKIKYLHYDWSLNRK
ncbi:MAG: DUF547 domain-containing protein [Desulfobacteraceae bacterium]|nr:DUF547 domain-containing protein [Desulfobacteraceae bacterium]